MNGQTVSYLALTLKHHTTTTPLPSWQKKSFFSPSVPQKEATRVPLTDLLLHVCSLVCSGPGQDARVGEAGPQQGEDHKQKQQAANHGYEHSQVLHQERTTVETKESQGHIHQPEGP